MCVCERKRERLERESQDYLNASLAHAAEISALVEAMAGMMFLTTCDDESDHRWRRRDDDDEMTMDQEDDDVCDDD